MLKWKLHRPQELTDFLETEDDRVLMVRWETESSARCIGIVRVFEYGLDLVSV